MSRLSQQQRDKNFFSRKGGDISILCERKYSRTAGQYYNNGTEHLDLGTQEMEFNWYNYRYSGQSSPRWKDIIAAGGDATTRMEAFRRELHVEPAGFMRDRTNNNLNFRYCNGPSPLWLGYIPATPQATFDTALLDKATSEARANFVKSYRKAVTQWASGQAIGEMAETVRFLKSPVRSLAKLTEHTLKDARGLMRKIRARTGGANDSAYLKEATDLWLGYKFGAAPLKSDIDDAMSTYNSYAKEHDGNDSHNPTVRLYGTGKAMSKSSLKAMLGYPGNAGSTAGVDINGSVSCTVRIRGAYRRGLPGVLPWDALGLAPNDWAPTVWEVLPFSWLADYFVNIGEMIDVMSFSLVELGWVNKTAKQETIVEISQMSHNGTAQGDNEGPYSYSYGGHILDRHVSVYREPTSFNFEVPPVRFKLPGLGQALNVSAVVNSLTSLSKGI
jgi:hypothetical protein